MPELANKRRERFAQFVAGNIDKPCSQTKAYRAAGYIGEGHVAHVGASRMMANDDVRNRVAELSEPAIVETGLSIERLLREIEQLLRDAREDRHHTAVAAALALVIRLHELIAKGAAAEPVFGGASTTEEIRAMLIEQAGGPHGAIEMANAMIEAAQAQLADQATLIG